MTLPRNDSFLEQSKTCLIVDRIESCISTLDLQPKALNKNGSEACRFPRQQIRHPYALKSCAPILEQRCSCCTTRLFKSRVKEGDSTFDASCGLNLAAVAKMKAVLTRGALNFGVSILQSKVKRNASKN